MRTPTLALLALLGACDGVERREVAERSRDWSVQDYAQACREAVGEVPAFSCLDGVEVPVTVAGVVPETYTPDMACDRPALLPPGEGEKTDGQCVPYSRVQVLADDARLQIQATCRKKIIRPADSVIFDEIDVIAHSVTTGTTCWFQATAEGGVDGSRVPSPTLDAAPEGYPDPLAFWNDPDDTAKLNCGGCHDSDPFYYSPWIAQTGQLPADPLGRYNNAVGPMKAWTPALALDTQGNTCTGCHRIGSQHTCQTGMYQSVSPSRVEDLSDWGKAWPQSHWMPVGNLWTLAQWDSIYMDSITELADCCVAPTFPGCIATPIDQLVQGPG